MAEINIIEWHLHPFRVERWYEAWKPALERAGSYGATSVSLTRSEEDPHHFRQTTVWNDRADFDRYWASEEVRSAREAALSYFNKPLLPGWHTPIEV